ncbi:hypothetical protein [Allorhodopirellula solitaria]|uniref:Uncharacterized protein n=1 Tax=Allorhodopirellula solitaria TaxID=2527987 RepID=A0A5C5WZI9_9BACT|nr:hypothetical protein [Allorhodopirellula solitaria]TWT56076.1 hypothetical protein CA85_45490 [Allorhodopirellula solitaria]
MMHANQPNPPLFLIVICLTLLAGEPACPIAWADEPQQPLDSKWSPLVDISKAEFSQLPKVDSQYITDRVARNRDVLIKGAFDYTLTMKRAGQIKNEFEQSGVFSFDEETQRVLHVHQDRTNLPAGRERTSTGPVDRPAINTVVRKAILRVGDQVETAVFEAGQFSSRSTFYQPQTHDVDLYPFHIQTLGLAFYGDIRTKRSSHEVLASYSNWPPFRVLVGRRDESTYISLGTRITFDKQHEFWPTSHLSVYPTGRKDGEFIYETISQCTTTLVSVSGLSLPSLVVYKAAKKPTMTIQLKWRSVNDDAKLSLLDQDVFIPNTISLLEELDQN